MKEAITGLTSTATRPLAPSLFRLLLYFALALMLATLQHRLRETNAPHAGTRYGTEKIAAFTSKTPIQRRILVPWAAVQLRDHTGIPLTTVELGIRTVTLCGVLTGLELLLVGLGWGAAAVAAPLLFACLLPLGFYANPVLDSFPSLLVLVAGLLCIQRERYGALCLLILVGTFVRESTLLLVLVFCAARLRKTTLPALWKITAAQVACYAAARGALSWMFPGPDYDATAGFNLHWVAEAGALEGMLRLLVLFLPLALAVPGLPRLTGLPRGMAIIGLLYAGGLCFVGRLSEPRIFWDAYLLVIPAILVGGGGDAIKDLIRHNKCEAATP
jgi:hypothetical protein